MPIVNVLDIVASLLYAFCIIIYLLLWQKRITLLRILAVFLIVIAVLQWSGSILANMGLYNIFLFNIICLVQLYFFSAFLALQLNKVKNENTNTEQGPNTRLKKINKKRINLLIAGSCTAITLLMVLQIAFNPKLFFSANEVGYLLTRAHILILTTVVILKGMEEKTIYPTINIGLFFFVAGTACCFLTLNYWQELSKYNNYIWILNALFSISFLLLLGTVGLKTIRNKN